MKELPRREMLSVLIEKLQEEPEIYLDRITEQTLWEMFENGCTHFVVRNSQIVGCCVIWHDLIKSDKEPAYVELGTVWAQKQDRSSIVAELGNNIHRIAKEKKLIVFCKQLKLAMYFMRSPIFPVNKIASHQNITPELMESLPQFRGWLNDNSSSTSEKCERFLYYEDDGKITPWYLVYED